MPEKHRTGCCDAPVAGDNMLDRKHTTKEMVRSGLTITLGLAVLGLFIVAFGGHRFWEKLDTYHIRFLTVKDLSVGRPVKYAGINIGRVLDISVDKMDPGQVHVTIGVQQDFAVYQGTVASITQKGLVGDNYVLLSLKARPGQKLPVQSEIPADTSTSIFEAAASVGHLVQELHPKLVRIADSLDILLATINSQDMAGVTRNMNAVLHNAAQGIKTMTTEIQAVSGDARQGIREARNVMRTVQGSAHKADEALESTRLAMEAVRMQTETLGGMLTALSGRFEENMEYDQAQVEEILRNTRELTENLNLLSRSLRDRPWQIIFHPDESHEITR